MSKNNKRPQRQKSHHVKSGDRQFVHRPQPPNEDRRTKRKRTRSDSERAELEDFEDDYDWD